MEIMYEYCFSFSFNVTRDCFLVCMKRFAIQIGLYQVLEGGGEYPLEE